VRCIQHTAGDFFCVLLGMLCGSSWRWGASAEVVQALYFVTAFRPSESACFRSSPVRRSFTAVSISLSVMVERLF
jgi:hypothetical protein